MAWTPYNLTLEDARLYLKHSGLRLNDGQYTDAMLDKAIRVAAEKFLSRTRVDVYEANLTVTSGDEDVDLTAATLPQFAPDRLVGDKPIEIATAGDHKYEPVRLRDYDWVSDRVKKDATTGRPQCINFRTHERAIVWPVPDAAWVLRLCYWRNLVSWELGTESPEAVTLNIPDAYVSEVIWIGAAAYLVWGETDTLYGDKGWRMFEQYVEEVAQSHESQPGPTYRNPDQFACI